jgi:DNA-directed RNA polymerase sigma subunit (sigma70/sigma32)
MAQTNSQDPNYESMQKHNTDKEISLLAIIQENSQLPEKEQQRYQQLWRKCEDQTLNEDELIEYQALLSQLEARNLKRIEALITLAQSRGKTLGEIVAELGLKEGNNAF